jgi:hypothetical protein
VHRAYQRPPHGADIIGDASDDASHSASPTRFAQKSLMFFKINPQYISVQMRPIFLWFNP